MNRSRQKVYCANLLIADGDRTHIPDSSRGIYEKLQADLERVKPKVPAEFRKHFIDMERRLNILFDHLNNEELLKPDTINEMNIIADDLTNRQHDKASALFTEIIKNKSDEGNDWMVSVLSP